MGKYHVAITRKVKPGMVQRFEEELREFARESLAPPGVTGVHLVGPLPWVDGGEYGILRSFESEEAGRAFYASELFADWERRVAPLVDGHATLRRLTGLEAFFRQSGNPPPRWKMAIITWLGVFPTVTLWSTLLETPFATLHWLLALAMMNVLVVVTLTWLVMPALTRLFAAWLRAD